METTNTQVTLAEALRPLMQFCLRLTGKEARIWLDAFKRFLRKEEIWVISSRWKVWKTAWAGDTRSIDEKIAAAIENNYELQDNHDLRKDLIAMGDALYGKEEFMHFTVVSPHELGLKPGFTQQEVFDAGIRQGLALCHQGDALDIVSQSDYMLPDNQWFTFAMNPVRVKGIKDPLLSIGKKHNGKFSFGTHNGCLVEKFNHPSHVDKKYVFRITKNSMH